MLVPLSLTSLLLHYMIYIFEERLVTTMVIGRIFKYPNIYNNLANPRTSTQAEETDFKDLLTTF